MGEGDCRIHSPAPIALKKLLGFYLILLAINSLIRLMIN